MIVHCTQVRSYYMITANWVSRTNRTYKYSSYVCVSLSTSCNHFPPPTRCHLLPLTRSDLFTAGEPNQFHFHCHHQRRSTLPIILCWRAYSWAYLSDIFRYSRRDKSATSGMFKLSDQLWEPAPWILLSFAAAARGYRRPYPLVAFVMTWWLRFT